MGQAAARVARQHLLGEEHGLQRLALDQEFGPRKRRAAAGAAHQLFEQARLLPGFPVRGAAQGLAPAEEARLRLHDAEQELDGIVEVAAVQGGDALLKLFAHAAREIGLTLLWHGKKL